jgi:hypothetical protein|tara:strand:+ start:591 stop:1580 length:990 start_codon:yes stop_codon:yes gene_type:complete
MNNTETKIILFWSLYNSKDIDFDNWRNKKIDILPLHHLSLQAHIKFKNDTTIYSYQKFNEGQIPAGIKVKDADEIFNSRQAFVSLKYGHSIAHISDVVRLKVASDISGIVMDMDAVVLKELPKQDCWFASMPAKLTGGFAPKWGNSHPPLYINDNSWNGKALASFPIKVNQVIKKDIASLSNRIIKTLKEEPSKTSSAWNYILWEVKKIMRINKEAKVFEPIYFCSLPAWLSDGKCYSLESPTRLNGLTELFGTRLPDIKEIFEKSFVVQHFFDSSANMQGGYGVTSSRKKENKNNFWKSISENCLLGKEAHFIIGENWKNILIEKTNK